MTRIVRDMIHEVYRFSLKLVRGEMRAVLAIKRYLNVPINKTTVCKKEKNLKRLCRPDTSDRSKKQ